MSLRARLDLVRIRYEIPRAPGRGGREVFYLRLVGFGVFRRNKLPHPLGYRRLGQIEVASHPGDRSITLVEPLDDVSLELRCKRATRLELLPAPTVDAAESAWLDFADRWGTKYPAIIGLWERSWEQFIPFLDFPVELRRLIYTTNAIESLNSSFRQAVRRRGDFPHEQAAMKVLYLCVKRRDKNRSNPTGRVQGWKKILNRLVVTYGERIETAIK